MGLTGGPPHPTRKAENQITVRQRDLRPKTKSKAIPWATAAGLENANRFMVVSWPEISSSLAVRTRCYSG